MQETYLTSNDYQIMTYVILYPIDTNNASNQYVTEWIRCINKICCNKIKYKRINLFIHILKEVIESINHLLYYQ